MYNIFTIVVSTLFVPVQPFLSVLVDFNFFSLFFIHFINFYTYKLYCYTIITYCRKSWPRLLLLAHSLRISLSLRWTADDFAAVPAAVFELLAVLGTAPADRTPAAALAGLAVPAANPVLAVPVAADFTPAPAARAAHHAGHAAAHAAPPTRGHVQSHSLRVRGSFAYIIIWILPAQKRSKGGGLRDYNPPPKKKFVWV